MVIHKEVRGTVILKGKLDIFIPLTGVSSNWKHWKATLDLKTCEDCRSKHGTIYAMSESPNPEPPLHMFCRCMIEPMRAVKAGEGSYEKDNGADWWLWHKGVLPNYYLSKNDLITLGWKPGRSPAKYAPKQMLTRGIYRNENGHLPDAPGRIWFEADLNYYSGKRNGHRVLWSNDGLMFVTYNHYESFIEVIGG